MSEARPNPDELLRALQQSTRRGRLKLYLGMSAGVGKTYAMLRAAQELRRQNREVLVGLVETHGRAETLALVEGLSVLPRRRVRHQNIDIEEFDLDAALARKPEVLLLDELAHTNAPGSRHEKRWQDVLELLDAGIEVHSTLNVQHLESRADSVAAMTGIRVTETVPDSLLDRASEIVVIDLDPHALLKRLEEGKIYGADRARIAREEFFREENLTALREIALRVTAERVDRDLQAIHKIQHPERPWRATERLLVAVYASPFSELMIRRTRLLASILDAPWFGAYVESGREMSEEEKRLLAANLALVRELGGEVLTTLDSDPAEGLLRLCRDHNVTQIVAGKSRRRGWRRYLDPSPTETFLAGKHPFDVYIVSGDPQRSMPSRSVPVPVPVETLGREIGLSALILSMTAGLSYLLLSLLDYRSIGLLLLLPVLASALFARPTVIVGASVAAALIWDFFFIEPYFTFVVDKHEDYLMLLVFLVVAGVTGVLTGRFRRQRGILEIRERQTNSLYRLTRSLAQADSASEMAQIAAKEIEALVGTGVQIYLRRDIGEGLDAAAGEFGEKERAVAEWVLKNGRAAGRFTSTLPAAEGAYYPVMTAESVLGVIGLRPLKQRPRAETILFLETLGAQVGLALQRDRLRQATRIAEMAQESERLSRNLLNVVSHELKTPLTAILTAADSLRGQHDSTSGGELLSAIEENGRRLTLIVDHMLESSRLEAGRVVVKQMPVDLRDIIASTLRRLEPELRSRTVEVDCPAALAFLETDEILLGTILRNLVHNACLHTPADAPIRLRVSSRERWLDIFVEDEGLGVEPSRRGKVFDKFWRGPDVAPGGLGLGLSLARGLAEALGGTLELIDGSSKGATFRLSLPSKGRP